VRRLPTGTPLGRLVTFHFEFVEELIELVEIDTRDTRVEPEGV
jgi:hypothetical protein